MAAETLSAKDVARELETDARTLRKFLRDTTPTEDHPGQGGRWAFTKADVKGLKKAFADWASGKRAKDKAEADAAPKAKAKKSKVAPVEDPAEDEDELDDSALDELLSELDED